MKESDRPHMIKSGSEIDSHSSEDSCSDIISIVPIKEVNIDKTTVTATRESLFCTSKNNTDESPSCSKERHAFQSFVRTSFKFATCCLFFGIAHFLMFRSLKEFGGVIVLLREQELRLNELMTLQTFLPKQLGQGWTHFEQGWVQQLLNTSFSSAASSTYWAQFEHKLEQLEQSWGLLNESISSAASSTYWSQKGQERYRPGYQLFNEHNVTGKYPVVMVPGFITSSLEIWKGKECANGNLNFRQRMWGAMDGFGTMFMNRPCWQEHLALDPYTGLDPLGIRVRAAESFHAADYFLGNYWVWEKLIQNLADIGYDASTMSMETYDWRLSFPMLEQRDGYLTKLRYKIEAFHKTTGEKVVLTSHSMGGQLVHYFLTWVTTDKRKGGGGGGKRWVDEHIHAYVNIAGSHLGVPKAASALLSGEMKDTVFMGTIGLMVEQFFGRLLRKDLFNTWGSLWGMLPQGGDALWGIGADLYQESNDVLVDQDQAAEKTTSNVDSHSDVLPLFVMTDASNGLHDEQHRDVEERAVSGSSSHGGDDGDDVSQLDIQSQLNATVQKFASSEYHSTSEAIDFLTEWGGALGPSLSSSRLYTQKSKSGSSAMSWLDLSKTPLPYAPKLKIYCLYGVGLDTERSYFYKRSSAENPVRDGDGYNSESWRNQVDLPVVLDTDYQDPERNIRHGIRFADGDGSVPLLSLGYVCVDAWNRPDSGLNPSGTKVITREYKHRQEFLVDDPMRGGPASADHVDILGNVEMTSDFLRVVSDFNPVKENRIVSNIEAIANEINRHPDGGLKKQRRRRFFSSEL